MAWVLAAFLFWPATLAPPHKISYRAQCLRVVDGDTFVLFVDMGHDHFRRLRIRLRGANAPELSGLRVNRKIAKAAGEYVSKVLNCPFGRPGVEITKPDLDEMPIRIEGADEDSFGRWVMRVRLPSGASLAGLLIQKGYAVKYTH